MSIASPQSRFNFELAAQSLEDSLRAVGRITHVTIVFDLADVSTHRAPALRGLYSAVEALCLLVNGSGLVVGATADGPYWILPASPIDRACADRYLAR